MSSTRSVKSPGIFANDALTTIPPVPVTGVSYRDAVNGTANIEDGWPYGERVNSAEYNQIMYQLSTLLEILDKQGILGWTDQVDYAVPAYVVGSDGRIYQALQASGPATTAQDPISAPTYWRPYLDSGVGNVWRVAVYATPGAISHTVEANTYWKFIEAVGGGGGGGAGGSTGSGTGGGAGAWGVKRVAVTPGQVIAGVVGARGNGGVGSQGAGSAGGATTIAGMTCGGGSAGAGGGTGGGGGGVVTGQDFGIQGGSGNSLSVTNTTGSVIFGPPGGGAARQGVNVGGYSSTAGIAAANYGNGGGGGSGGSAGFSNGGNGAPGLILIWG